MKHHRARVLVCGVAVVVAAAAMVGCGSDSDNSVSSPNNSGTNNSTETSTTLGPGKESDYVGLTKSAAIAKAKAEGRPWRIGREDGESFPGTLDYNPDRVTFEIDNGKVTKATFG